MARSVVSSLLIAVIAINAFVSGVPANGSRTLVILDDGAIQNSHSSFFQSLQARGHRLTFKMADDSEIRLKRYGEFLFDNIILFAPSAEHFGAGADVSAFLDFVDSGHNIFVAGDRDVAEPMREFANECGVDFDAPGSSVIDHFNFDASDANGEHTLILADKTIGASIIANKPDSPVLYQGIGHAVSESNPLLLKVLRASSTAYSFDTEETITDYPLSAGSDTLLVSAVQARNNARVTFTGSLDMCSDKFFNSVVQRFTADGPSKKHERSGNQRFCEELSQWTFGEKGVLRAENISHHRVGESTAPNAYRIKDDIEYAVDILEWNGEQWVPYTSDDVQVEFVMLDPYVRTGLKKQSPTAPTFSVQFKVPDVYGVFTFRVNYHRPGYTSINLATQAPVRPFKHNEYDRFIPSAYPYYLSAFSMMAGVFIFGWVFLYHKPTQ
eukprot:GILJ01004020.1.p1 GENE.GILJ01004020.1~~GILJ01004020.1.p1  ORF type:complete len:453 (+),score=72.39 GILJ01004020.1:42-1361(+)